MHTYLPFISDTDFARAAGYVVHAIHRTREKDFDLGRNALDPFGAIFQCAALQTDLTGWKEFELQRQTTKAIQNAIGAFHQELIGSLPGWQLLPPSGGLDVLNLQKRICAEVKNKYNTTKGNHLPRLYDDLQRARQKHHTTHPGETNFTAYIVHIIPRAPRDYDRPFTPTDNKVERPEDPHIREITAALFYDRATGKNGALRAIYQALPSLLEEVFDIEVKLSSEELTHLFTTHIRPPSK